MTSHPVPLTISRLRQFFAKVEFTDSCWLWTASKNKGYGQVGVNGYPVAAHRAVYSWFRDGIDSTLDIDHLCRVPACVNPNHMEQVTRRENTRRGRAWSLHEPKTHCVNGHEYTPENTRIDGAGKRRCLICTRRSAREGARRRYKKR